MARVPTMGDTIIIAQQHGDRPAIVTRAGSGELVEVCAFMPLPEHIKVVRIHANRQEAIGAGLKSTGYHGYWKP
jgi:hypothetical protein